MQSIDAAPEALSKKEAAYILKLLHAQLRTDSHSLEVTYHARKENDPEPEDKELEKRRSLAKQCLQAFQRRDVAYRQGGSHFDGIVTQHLSVAPDAIDMPAMLRFGIKIDGAAKQHAL